MKTTHVFETFKKINKYFLEVAYIYVYIIYMNIKYNFKFFDFFFLSQYNNHTVCINFITKLRLFSKSLKGQLSVSNFYQKRILQKKCIIGKITRKHYCNTLYSPLFLSKL